MTFSASPLFSRPLPGSVLLWALLLSCLFSLIRILDNPLLNDDAYGYLRAAELFKADGIGAVLDGYGWYGYSILIALADRILPGGLITSAHLINTTCYALLVYVFIRVCTTAYAQEPQRYDLQRIQLFAAITILAFPLINEMRYFLIRDIAFCAFALLSLLCLLRFNRSGRLLDAFYWTLTILAATAFRLEGLLFAALAPVAIAFDFQSGSAGTRLIRCGKLLLVLLGCVILAFLLALTVDVNLFELALFAWRYYLPRLFELGTVAAASATSLNEALFTPDNFPGSDNVVHGLVILVFAYIFTVLNNLVEAFSVPLTLFMGYALWRGHLQLPAPLRAPLLIYLASALLALLVFLFVMRFQTQRYATFACILLLLLVPGTLDAFYQRESAKNRQGRFKAAFAFVCVYLFTDSLVSFGHSTAYVQQAIAWSIDSMPADSRLHTNSFSVAYHSKRIPDFDKISLLAAENVAQSTAGDYLILAVGHDDDQVRAQLESDPHLQLLQRYANKRGDEALIYRHE